MLRKAATKPFATHVMEAATTVLMIDSVNIVEVLEAWKRAWVPNWAKIHRPGRLVIAKGGL